MDISNHLQQVAVSADENGLVKSTLPEKTIHTPCSKKDIFLYKVTRTGLVQPPDKIVVRSSHESILVRSAFFTPYLPFVFLNILDIFHG